MLGSIAEYQIMVGRARLSKHRCMAKMGPVHHWEEALLSRALVGDDRSINVYSSAEFRRNVVTTGYDKSNEQPLTDLDP